MCDSCLHNFEKLSSYIDELHLLRENWDLPIRDNTKINKLFSSKNCINYSDLWYGNASIYRYTFHKIASYLDDPSGLIEGWNLPETDDILFEQERERKIQTYKMFLEKNPNFIIDPTWSICQISDSCTKISDHIEELKKHEIIYLGWGYSRDITVLATLPKLKVLICGYWFGESLNSLVDSPSLEYICVRRSYNGDLIDKIYDKTSYPGDSTIEKIIYSYLLDGSTYNITMIGGK